MAKLLPPRTNWVTAIDPDTGRAATMTQKAFDGVYREKGFELADRENISRAEPGGARRGRNLGEGGDAGEGSGQQTGSAADIADKLNLGDGKTNAKHANNKGAIAEGREPSGRNRTGR